jgi:hypothetical protein
MLFEFEQDFAQKLNCIPLSVRFKLDCSGIKLKLKDWLNLSLEQRQWLINCPLAEGFAEQLQAWVNCQPIPIPPVFDWQDKERIPELVQAQMTNLDQSPLSLAQWQVLGDIQRFVLIKLSSPHHENRNFLPALREFGLMVSQTTESLPMNT